MQSFAAVVVFLVALGAAQAQHFSSESCPNVQLVQNFDASKIFGTWYESLRYYVPVEGGARCINAQYSASSFGDFDIVYSFNQASGSRAVLEGTAYQSGAPKEADYTVIFKNGNSLPYSILGTDYSSYIIIYRCVPANSGSNRNVWIMVKDQKDENAVAEALNVLIQNNLDVTPLIISNQSGC